MIRSPASAMIVYLGAFVLLLQAAPGRSASVEDNLQALRRVSSEGAGHAAAMAAVRELSQGSGANLVPILSAFDDANPLTVNWLRGTFETLADRQLKAGSLPAAALEQHVKNTQRSPISRRLAYEWLLKVDPSAADRLIPGFLQDASPEFRRDAVARLIQAATAAREAKRDDDAKTLFRQALTGAVDDDQVKLIVAPLRELGDTIDLQKHFGFLTDWHLVGPFDNAEMKGFQVAYPPEKAVDLAATYPAKTGDVQWKKYSTTHEYGILNIAKQVSPYKGAAMYATTTFDSEQARPVEFRLGTPNAWKLWVNGELVFARDEYHRGTQMDQYRVSARLREGPNVILLKICQNEQTEEWAQDYQYQIRVCDSTGAAIAPRRSSGAASD